MRKLFRKVTAILLTFVIIAVLIPFGAISVSAAYNYLFPVNNGGVIAFGYGYSESYGGTHNGIDIHSTGDDTIYAACDGVVEATANSCPHVSIWPTKCEHYNTFGNYIRIGNSDGTKAYYGHLKQNSLLVSVGQSVRRGQAIASMGSSGFSSGKHLHFELRISDYRTTINTNPSTNGGEMNYSYSGYGGSGTVDLGTDFYACIINTPSWKHISVAYDNNVVIRKGKPVASADQLWHFERQNDGSYKISTLANGYCLDVRNGDNSAGANVQVYPSNDSDAQRWYITGYSGNYHIRPKCSECVLDLYNGFTADDTNVQLYNLNNSDAQRFEIYKGDETPFAADIGTGFIAPLVHKASWITLENDINNDLTIQKANASPRQFWKFVRQADCSYKIYSCYDGKCVDVEVGSTETGANVRLYDENNTDAQRWYFYSVNGEYMIQSKLTGKFLDLPNQTYGASLYQWDRNYTAAQIFSVYRGTESAMINPALSVSASKNAHFSWNDVQAENNYSLKIWESSTNSDEPIFLKNDISENSTELDVDLPAGKYCSILSAYNIYQNMSSNTVEFEIVPYIETTVIMHDQYVKILHGVVYGATEYNIEIYNADNNELVKAANSLPETTIDLSLDNGNYYAVMKTDNGIQTEKKYFSIKKALIGDTNLDSRINVNDVTAIQRHLADLETFTEEQLTVADTNGDGNVDIADATHLQMYLAEYGVVLGKQ